MSECSEKPIPVKPRRQTSSIPTVLKRKPADIPPYSSGICEQSIPASPALFHSARSMWPSFSHCAWKGTASCSRNLRTLSRNCSCSELKIVLGIMTAPKGKAKDKKHQAETVGQSTRASHWTHRPINKTIQPPTDHLPAKLPK